MRCTQNVLDAAGKIHTNTAIEQAKPVSETAFDFSNALAVFSVQVQYATCTQRKLCFPI